MVAKDPKVIKVGGFKYTTSIWPVSYTVMFMFLCLDFGMARDIYSSDYYVKHGQGWFATRLDNTDTDFL